MVCLCQSWLCSVLSHLDDLIIYNVSRKKRPKCFRNEYLYSPGRTGSNKKKQKNLIKQNTTTDENTACQSITVISSIKLGRFWRNLANHFLNKSAAKFCKRFPPYLNNVSTLPCKTWNARQTRVTLCIRHDCFTYRPSL